MNAEFQWWLLILGIVIGGALVYLVLADMGADDAAADEPLDDGTPDDRTLASRPAPGDEAVGLALHGSGAAPLPPLPGPDHPG